MQLTHASVVGIIKQVKKPLSNLLAERDLLETDGSRLIAYSSFVTKHHL